MIARARERWRLGVLLLAGGALVLAAMLAIVFGRPGSPDEARADRVPTQQGSSSASAPQSDPQNAPEAGPPEAPSSEESSDPLTFVRAVAAALFDWDTTTSTPADVTEAMLPFADPTGEHTPALLADVPAYVPDDRSWQQLAEYRTRQRLEITNTEISAAWTRAMAAGQIPDVEPGTTAVTVEGVRHREGVVAGAPESARSAVAFTMFVVCPSDGGCWLLRLGEPGKVLE